MEIAAIHQPTAGRLGLTLVDRATAKPQTVTINGLFVRIGIEPNTAFLQGQVALDEAGYLLVDRAQRTVVPNVYAIGDVVRPVCLSVATAIGHGAIAVKDIAQTLQSKGNE
jgi:thioredoxin reductase (NADPH)